MTPQVPILGSFPLSQTSLVTTEILDSLSIGLVLCIPACDSENTDTQSDASPRNKVPCAGGVTSPQRSTQEALQPLPCCHVAVPSQPGCVWEAEPAPPCTHGEVPWSPTASTPHLQTVPPPCLLGHLLLNQLSPHTKGRSWSRPAGRQQGSTAFPPQRSKLGTSL